MSIDLRCKHDRTLRERAAELFAEGRGHEPVAGIPGIPPKAAGKRRQAYRKAGRDGPPNTGETHADCGFETKAAAAGAAADGGTAGPEATERFGVAGAGPPDGRCRLYREGGAEALRPKPRGPGGRPAPGPAGRSSRSASASPRRGRHT